LYFNQGLPFGFFLLTLPILLREQGASATLIGGLMLLALPWTLKVLWAPWVDRDGLRIRWILGLQVALLGTLAALAFTINPWLVALGVFAINALIATQDIAVDGMAYRMLSPAERGWGNSIQAAAYKVGMLVGGGLLPALTLGDQAATGWHPTMLALAALCLPALAIAFMLREPMREEASTPRPSDDAQGLAKLRELVMRLSRLPGARWVILFVIFSKFGDNLGTGMFRVFLVDHGWAASRIAAVTGGYGLVASITGSLLMAIPLARLSRGGAFLTVAIAQAVLQAGVGFAALGWVPESQWAALIVVEHFVSGAVTTVLFTLLMDFTPAEMPGSGFTALTVLSSAGMGLGSMLGGVIVDLSGFSLNFFLAGAACLLPVVFIKPALESRSKLELTS
jgi:MFS family permease